MKFSCEEIKSLSIFSEVPEVQLEWLLQNAECEVIEVGGHIFKKGEPIDKLIILIEGEVAIKTQRDDLSKIFAIIEKGSVTGYLPYSRATTASGYGEVVKKAKLLVFPKSRMKELTLNNYDLTKVLVNQMTTRAREFTKTNYQSDKLMALGKLSAGLAHELNNPASAMVSSAKELKKQLGAVPDKFKRLISMKTTPESVEIINEVLFSKLHKGKMKLTLTEKSELEESIETWLEDHHVENAYLVCETLAEYGFDESALEKIYIAAGASNFPSSIEWIENVLTTETLVDEIGASSTRISDLVKAIKNYSHMDRGTHKSPMNLSESIDTTLIMLKHKYKAKNLIVENNVSPSLAQPEVVIGEINQVWTNIIDNAIDAVEKNGCISIDAKQVGEHIVVAISDDGMGISHEDLDHVFDPFFTTKKLGEGTGLGLDVSYRIVNQHKGKIEVQSSSEGTTFEVYLPIN